MEDEGQEPRPPKKMSRLSLAFATVGVVIVVAASAYLYIAARDAMAGPGLNLPDDELYVKRCGSCHAVPAPEAFGNWGSRDWARMLPLTMFMPGEQDRVHHYLERISGTSSAKPASPR